LSAMFTLCEASRACEDNARRKGLFCTHDVIGTTCTCYINHP